MKNKYFIYLILVIFFSQAFGQKINNDILIVLKNDGKISAYDLNSLENQWNFEFSDSSTNKMRNQFHIEKNVLFAVSTQNTLASLDVNTGTTNWIKTTFEQEEKTKRYQTSGQRLPILNEMIFVANNVNGLQAFNKKNGQKIWSATMHYPFNNYPPVIKNNKIYIQSAPLVYCFDASSGKLLWYKNFETVPMYTLITANNENIFVGDEANNLYALDLQNGNEKWKYSTTYKYPDIDENIILSDNGNELYFASQEENGFSVSALNTKTGTEIWKKMFDNTNKKIKTISLISDHLIITTKDEQNYFYVLNPKNGDQIKSELPKEQPLSNLIKLKNGQIAFLTKSSFTTFDINTKKFQEKPILMEYDINDDFNLHFDIAYKTN